MESLVYIIKKIFSRTIECRQNNLIIKSRKNIYLKFSIKKLYLHYVNSSVSPTNQEITIHSGIPMDFLKRQLNI